MSKTGSWFGAFNRWKAKPQNNLKPNPMPMQRPVVTTAAMSKDYRSCYWEQIMDESGLYQGNWMNEEFIDESFFDKRYPEFYSCPSISRHGKTQRE